MRSDIMNSIPKRLQEIGAMPLNTEDIRPLSEDEIRSIEAVIGSSLPESYRRHLANHGGLLFPTGVNCSPSDEPFWLGCLFGFPELSDAIEYMRDILPETIIPIGDDGGDNVLCLGVAGDAIGQVYVRNTHVGWDDQARSYLDRGEPIPSELRYQGMNRMFDSFDSLIANTRMAEDV